MNITDRPGPVWKITGPGGMSESVHRSYTIADIAAALDIKPKTVSGYRSRGQMPDPSGMVGRTPYWTPARIEPWIEQQRANRRHIKNTETT